MIASLPHHHHRLKERSRHSFRNSHQFPLAGIDLDQRRAGKLKPGQNRHCVIGCPPGSRTPICRSRGGCPTIERGGIRRDLPSIVPRVRPSTTNLFIIMAFAEQVKPPEAKIPSPVKRALSHPFQEKNTAKSCDTQPEADVS